MKELFVLWFGLDCGFSLQTLLVLVTDSTQQLLTYCCFIGLLDNGWSFSFTESRQFLLYAGHTEIRGVDLENPYFNYIISFPAPSFTVVDYDASENRIYWSDVQRETIKMAFINGTGLQTVASVGTVFC